MNDSSFQMRIDEAHAVPFEEPTEDELQQIVKCRMEESRQVQEVVKKNIAKAQEKQKEQYQKRHSKGVKTYEFSVGQKVSKRNNRNKYRQGGKLEALWKGPYTITAIYENQRVQLKNIKTLIAYDQLQPYNESYLHQNTAAPVVEDATNDVQDIQALQNFQAVVDVQVINVEDKEPHDPWKDQFEYLATGNEWLEDTDINYCLNILKKQFPDIGGFGNVNVFYELTLNLIDTCKGPFIQIVNMFSNHWVTFSNIDLYNENRELENRKVINVYDSLYCKYTEFSAHRIACFAASIMKTSAENLEIRVHDIPKQSGSNDCGYFAIGIAQLLATGYDPSTFRFHQSEIRYHLSNCVLFDHICAFPGMVFFIIY